MSLPQAMNSLGAGSLVQCGALAAEVPGRRRVGLVELDVAAAGAGPAQRVVRIEFGRVQAHAGLGHPDGELVVAPGFAPVSGQDGPVDVAELVGPGRSADETGPRRLLARGRLALVDEAVSRDAGP